MLVLCAFVRSRLRLYSIVTARLNSNDVRLYMLWLVNVLCLAKLVHILLCLRRSTSICLSVCLALIFRLKKTTCHRVSINITHKSVSVFVLVYYSSDDVAGLWQHAHPHLLLVATKYRPYPFRCRRIIGLYYLSVTVNFQSSLIFNHNRYAITKEKKCPFFPRKCTFFGGSNSKNKSPNFWGLEIINDINFTCNSYVKFTFGYVHTKSATNRNRDTLFWGFGVIRPNTLLCLHPIFPLCPPPHLIFTPSLHQLCLRLLRSLLA
jgi:hypothetical protein